MFARKEKLDCETENLKKSLGIVRHFYTFSNRHKARSLQKGLSWSTSRRSIEGLADLGFSTRCERRCMCVCVCKATHKVCFVLQLRGSGTRPESASDEGCF